MIDLPLLTARLKDLNSQRATVESGRDAERRHGDASVDRLIAEASERLAVYGSLAPGQENAWVLKGLCGSWTDGIVRGHLIRVGWGEVLGYPGLTWDPDGPDVAVRVFASEALASAWSRIDAFEGSDYRRILVPVRVGDRVIVANIYEVAH